MTPLRGRAGRPADRFYAINRASDGFFRAELARLPPGSQVLDYGCGEGAYAAIEAARRGHKVVAVDLSPVAIEHARRDAERGRCGGRPSTFGW